MRRCLAWLADDEPVPNVWAAAADVVRGELARRELERLANPLAGLSRSALAVLEVLREAGGSAEGSTSPVPPASLALLEEQQIDVRGGLDELVARGLVELTFAVVEGEWPPVAFAMLRADLLPEG